MICSNVIDINIRAIEAQQAFCDIARDRARRDIENNAVHNGYPAKSKEYYAYKAVIIREGWKNEL